MFYTTDQRKGFLSRLFGGIKMIEWLFSGAGGMIVGAILSIVSVVFLLGEWGDRRQRKRELKRVLRILDTEIAGNERLLRIFDEHPAWITQAPVHSLQTKAWEDVKIALVFLLKNDERFYDIASYYENIQAIERDRLLLCAEAETSEEEEEYGHQRFGKQLRFLLEQTGTVRRYICESAGVSEEANLITNPLDLRVSENP